jgi:hypothetical protein
MCRRLAVSRGADLALLLALLGLDCSDPAAREQRFVLGLRAVTAFDAPVSDTRFWADGRELGTTDLRGALRAELNGQDGQAVSLSVACPPSYRTRVDNRRIVLRHIEGKTPSQASDFELTAHCEPLERSAAVVVRARGPGVAGLPIRVGGDHVGQTDIDGTAHLLLKARPRSSVRVQLETSARPELVPHDPVQTFQLDDEDSILLVDQSFALAPRRHYDQPRAAFAPAPSRVHVPYRIDSRATR